MPTADWPTALAAIDRAAATALAALDEYEARWRGELTADAPAVGVGVHDPSSPTDAPADWGHRLAAVADLADAAGRDLADRAESVSRWRESLQRALHLVEGEPCHGSR
ncbi:MAG: hypothetical protein K2X87_29690 [Gemmataceae bacterium]|nr:hypothetical protein [Gemmataceae bacterium]